MERSAVVRNIKHAIQEEEMRFTWKISGIGPLLRGIVRQEYCPVDDYLDEQKLRLEFGHKIGYPMKWEIYLSSEGSATGQRWIELVALFRHNEANRGIPARQIVVTLEIEDAEGCTVDVKKLSMTVNTDTQLDWNLRLRLFNPLSADAIQRVRDNNGAIKLFMKLTVESPHCLNENTVDEVKLLEQQNFLEDISVIRHTTANENFDVQIRVAGSASLLGAHRAILSAVSPVFAKMFQSGMTEATTGLIDIADLSELAVNVILHFVYTGSLRADWGQVVAEIVYGADKYQLLELTGLVNHAMMNLCTADNAQQLLDIVTMHDGFEKAKSDIEYYIQRERESNRQN